VIVERIPLARHEDGRGWFVELARASALPTARVLTGRPLWNAAAISDIFTASDDP